MNTLKTKTCMCSLKKGVCIVCNGKCDEKAVCHESCAILYQDVKQNRIKRLMEKYGDGLTFQKVLIGEKDL